ncbi:peroxiredoxin family protein [Edaphobacter bradus]|uniref:peroxiredoxin family protein n=1 Tax=Edaphobacter bradus TaxID=2259016 RepID=UPI0021E00186|nr:TlpA disulfide reductase family protein [Edaphobacter bradus]
MKIHLASKALLAAALLAAPFSVSAQQAQKPATQPALHNAPDFTRTSLDGKTIRLSSYRGKLVLLNFWATWCGPCIAEIPRFSGWQTKYGPQGLEVIGVSMDDDASPVKKFVGKQQLTYPVVMGDEHLGELYGGVLGLPISYLISPEGKILARYQGETDLNKMETTLTSLLPKKKL